MSRPTRLIVAPHALLHNLEQIKSYAPGKKIIAMVKANAYGCGIKAVVPVLDGQVEAFGVACLEEALAIRALGSQTQCILFQGVFGPEEFVTVAQNHFACVLHQPQQLQWLLNTPLAHPISLWIKVNTGMNRLGFKPDELQAVMTALHSCSWVHKDIGLMTHIASSDQADRIENSEQISLFQSITTPGFSQRSMANSAAIISFPQTHADAVRPGIMLFGVSPFANQTASDLGLIPVMRFQSAISAIRPIPHGAQVGYGGDWKSNKPSVMGIVAVGYGDGYPRHIGPHTPVWVNGREVYIIGRISMDMLAIDLTDHKDIQEGDTVQLWGDHILVERIAQSAGTVGYELLCQISERVRYY